MRILILGGTVFLSHRIAADAVAGGHEVVCASRGVSGSVPEGALLVPWDRAEPAPARLTLFAPDVVVDVARTPSFVRRGVAAFPDAHWLFVSTCSVYADTALPGATADAELLAAIEEDRELSEDPGAYGGMKAACEAIVRDGVASSCIVRPGLIVGPGDPSGRFTYWPVHAREAARDGAPLLAPGDPADPVQLIDVRDLSRWIVSLAEARTAGVYDGISPAMPRSELLAAVIAGAGAAGVDVHWAPSERLLALDVAQWAGPRSLPLWIAEPGMEGFLARDVTASLDAGLRPRPVEESARATLAWLDETPDAPVAGLTRAEEREVLNRV